MPGDCRVSAARNAGEIDVSVTGFTYSFNRELVHTHEIDAIGSANKRAALLVHLSLSGEKSRFLIMHNISG